MKKISNWLLRLSCPDHLIEDLLGDLEEQYQINSQNLPLIKASWYYFKDTLSILFSYSIQKRKSDRSYHTYSTTQNSLPMLKNYIKVTIRSMAKQKLFTIINVIGFSAGMSIGILYLTLISFIQTYDNFHENRESIYRIITNTTSKAQSDLMASTPAPLGQTLRDTYSGFGKITLVNKSLRGEAEFGKKAIPVSGYFTDENFLDMFSFKLIQGTASLNDKHSILLTETFAKKLFSEKDPINQTISLGNMGDYIVSGILQDIPKNSHMRFEVLLPYNALMYLNQTRRIDTNLDNWVSFKGNYTYFMLPDQSNISKLSTDLNSIANEQYRQDDDFNASFDIQPLSEVRLLTDIKDEIGMAWSTDLYWMAISLTLLILLPACFNYANISTARALSRSKEIGMRKVVGGIKKQIFFQFIIETMIISIISLCGAYAIFFLISPEFQSMLAGGTTSIEFTVTPVNFIYCLLFAIFTGALAGIFPAIHFSGIKPLRALTKTSTASITGNTMIQKGLLAIQFTISFGFILGVIVFLEQYRTTMDYDLGFSYENVLDIELQDVSTETLRPYLNQMASVNKVSMSSHILGVNSNETEWFYHNSDSTKAIQMFIDSNYLSNLELELVAGKNLVESPSGREQFALVNEEFIKKCNYQNASEAIDKLLRVNDSTELLITGVVKNFHFQNLTHTMTPFVFRSNSDKYAYANTVIDQHHLMSTLNEIERRWSKLSSEKLKANFFKDEINEAFNIYAGLVKVFFFLGLLAISISCLGLLAMVIYTTKTRTKEVGIRKVLGASSEAITYLLSKDYLMLLIVASIISIPLSYRIISVLVIYQNVYSSGISLWQVITSLFILFVLALFTVVSQTWTTANTNPTETIRHE